MFKQLKFVISSNEPKETLTKSIKENGGIIQKTITKNVDYYIQSWNTEDEGKLGQCNDLNVKVVPQHYIIECISIKSIIPFNVYSINEYKQNQNNIWSKMIASKLFVSACTNSLEYESIPQTIQEFEEYKWAKPTNKKQTIYILPINTNIISFKLQTNNNNKCPPIKKRKLNKNNKISTHKYCIDKSLLMLISEFVSSYFQLNVTFLDEILFNINQNEVNYNITVNNKLFDINYRKQNQQNNNNESIQYEVCDIIDAVLELYENNQKSKNGYCIIGITNEDIFEQDSGYGILRGRAFGGSSVAVFSSYHYNNNSSIIKNKMEQKLLLLNTIGHELLHCCGLDHCSFYSCIMNAWTDLIDEYNNYNNKDMTDLSVSSMHSCPIDLKKLQQLIGFDVKKRYKSLQLFYQKYSMTQQTKWIKEICNVI